MQEFPISPLRKEEDRQAWRAKLDDPTWGAVAAAVLEVPSGVELAAGQLNATTWSKAAMTLVDIARKEEAKEMRAANYSDNYPKLDEKAMEAWHAKIAKAIIPVVAAGFLGWTGAAPAFAGDAGEGAQIFSGNCAACHAGGQNVIMPEKTLEQVTNGKNAMPAFGGRLSDADIQNVATYVITTAKEGWE